MVQPRSAYVYCALLLSTTGAAQGNTDERVRINGRVLVPDHLHTPVDLTVVEGDSTCAWVAVKGGGRFRLEALPDQCYILRFDQAGSLSRAVRVDTRFATRKVGGGPREVKFDVILAPTEELGGLHYTGPVGRIKFHRSNGRQLVARNYSMQRVGLLVMEDMPACDPAPH